MPDLAKLEQFNQELIKLGNEPEVSAKRGETIERVLTPQEYPMDHGGTGIRTNKAPAASVSVPGSGPSTDDFLSQLDPELFSQDASAENPLPESAGVDTDLGSQFGDTTTADDSNPDLPGDFDSLFDDELLAGRPALVPPPPVPDSDVDFSFEDLEAAPPVEDLGPGPAENIDDFSGLFDEMESAELPDSGDAAVSGEEVPPIQDEDFNFDLPSAGEETTGFSDIDEFNLDDLGAIEDISAAPSDAADHDVETELNIQDIPDSSDIPEIAEIPEPETDFDEDFANFDFGDDSSGPPTGANNESEPVKAPQPGPDFGMAEMPDFATDMGADFGSDDFADEFNMGDFGKDFGVMEEFSSGGPSAEPEVRQSLMEEVDEVIAKASDADEAEAFDISATDFKHIQDSLAAMPLNLKVATEEALSNPQYPFEAIHPLISALIRGESPKDIAVLVSRVSGKRIKVPAGYEKRSGLAFEQEQRSFAYQFRENILPMVKLVSLTFIALALVAYASYQWVVRPLVGGSLFDQGVAAIRAEQYEQGNQKFKEAYKWWPDNNRYLQYGRAFRDMRQWSQARLKYEELLGMPERRQKPFGKDRLHRQGILDFADFAAYTLRDYNIAVNYLQRLVEINKYDHDPVIAQGDVFMEWARYTGPRDRIQADKTVMLILSASYPNKGENESKILLGPVALYGAARYDYASLIDKEGQLDSLLSRMLRYFMRLGAFTETQAAEAAVAAERAGNTGDFAVQREKEAEFRALHLRSGHMAEEVDKIRELFVKDLKAKPEPAIIAELAGDIIDKAEGKLRFMEDALTLGLKAEKSGPKGESEPSLHYQLARYYRYMRDEKRESETLKWARHFFELRQKDRPLDRFELREHIDTFIRQGELLYGPLYGGKDAINAQVAFEEARTMYEQGLQTRMIRERSSLFGRVYAHLGDLKYYEAADYEAALRQYRLARQNQYGLPPDELALAIPRLSMEELTQAAQDISYKSGFIWTTLANRLPEGQGDKALMYDQAAREFMQVQGAIPLQNDNLDYALANLSYLRGNYDTAASAYRQLADRIEGQRTKLSKNIAEEDLYQRELVEFLVRIDNNLGVSLYKLALQGGRYRDQNLAQGQFHISRATELYQGISHDPLVPDQPDAGGDLYLLPAHFGLAYLNLQSIVKRDGAVEIFRELRKDLAAESFATVLTKGGAGR